MSVAILFKSPLSLNKNEIREVALEKRATAPVSPVEAQLYYNENGGVNRPEVWDGSVWKPLANSIKADGGAPNFGDVTLLSGSRVAIAESPAGTFTFEANVSKSDVGLSVVDNTSDATKNSANATLTNKTIDGNDNTLLNIPQSAISSLIADLAAKELVANKSTDTNLGTSDTLYPTQKAVKTYIDAVTAGLLDDRGNYDASVNLYPTTGGSGTAGAVAKGDLWFISVAGTLGGNAVNIGDMLRALVDLPGQTSSNWAVAEGNLGYVPENQANKSNDSAMAANSSTLYPTQQAVVGYVGTAVGGRVANNAPITGATKTKVTYDAKGLVTAGADATTADIADSLDARYVTDAEKTKLANTSGVNSGDQTIALTGDVVGSGTGSFSTTIQNNVVGDAKIGSHTSTKITITAKAQLNSEIAYKDQANTFADFDQTFRSSRVLISNPANSFAYTLVASAIAANRSLTLPLLTQNETLAVQPQVLQSTPANPTGTASTVGVMAGLAASITPRVTGRVFIVISGVLNNGTGDNGASAQIRTGTGAAPVNGAVLTGTTRGNLARTSLVASGATNLPNIVPFTCNDLVVGLVVGTAIWIDLSEAAITGGTASLTNISISAFEL